MEILYEDSCLLVCIKEPGIPVQSAKIGVRDMVSILKTYRKESEGMRGEPYLGIVHRLDQPVGGVLVFAKTREAAAGLSAQMQSGKMKKEYLAVTCGKPKKTEGHLEHYLLRDGRTNASRAVEKGQAGAKLAVLDYKVLQTQGDLSLVSILLSTGRHHQIRVQMAQAKMPLAGDRKYQPNISWKPQEGLALWACRLTFAHPKTKKSLTFEAPPRGFFFEKFHLEG